MANKLLQDLPEQTSIADDDNLVVGGASGTNTDTARITKANAFSGFATDASVALKADKANVLELDNTDAFTPDTDYEPATKKYVDDSTTSLGTDDITNNSTVAGATTTDALQTLQTKDTTQDTTITTNTTNISTNTTKLATIEDGAEVNTVDSVNSKTGIVVLTTGDVAEDTDKNYVTDAQKTVIGNTSGTNTGDQDISGISTNATNITTNATNIATNATNIATNATDIATNVTDISNHTSDTANPHSVTATQVGKDTAQWNADKIKGITVGDLTGIVANEYLGYNSTSGEFEPQAPGTPAAHASTHEDGGSDEIDLEGLSVGVGVAVGTTNTQSLTNKSLEYPTINGSIEGTAILDEDDMASDSDSQVATQQSIKAYVDAAMELLNPIGTIREFNVSTNPATLLGFGTWSAYGTGRVTVGIDTSDTDFDTIGETGGEKTHTLTTSEMPAHTHTQNVMFDDSGTDGLRDDFNSYSTGTIFDQGISTQSTGGDLAHNNVQPYITIYRWVRTA